MFPLQCCPAIPHSGSVCVKGQLAMIYVDSIVLNRLKSAAGRFVYSCVLYSSDPGSDKGSLLILVGFSRGTFRVLQHHQVKQRYCEDWTLWQSGGTPAMSALDAG